MNKFFIKLIILAALLSAHAIAWAAVPNWTVVNQSQYEHSMTITSVLNIDGIMANQVTDKVGAFIDGVCVGVSSPEADASEDGSHIVSLTVKSSTPLGSVITFKLYDASLDKELDAVNTVVFKADTTIGNGPQGPYLITTNRNPSSFSPLLLEIMEGKEVGTVIGRFKAEDPDGAADFVFTMVTGEGNEDSASFKILDKTSLRSNKVFDYQTKKSYSIRVKASDGKGGILEDKVIVKIIPDPNNFSALNYISPNNDGKNDVWTIRNVEVYKEYTITIFNDAGIQVFSTTNYQNDWDGTYQGQELPVGVYYYLARSPEDNKFTGTITLNR